MEDDLEHKEESGKVIASFLDEGTIIAPTQMRWVKRRTGYNNSRVETVLQERNYTIGKISWIDVPTIEETDDD